MSWDQIEVQGSKEKATFGCRIKTDARETRVVGPYGDRIKIAVNAPAKKGKANEELVSFLSEVLQLDERWIEISSGTSSPDKRVQVRGRSPAVITKLFRKHSSG